MKDALKITTVFFLIYLAAIPALHAQHQWDHLKFQRFGVNQGLTVTTAFSIAQDDNGFLWISTIDGLQRYDGYKFTPYKNDFNDSTSVSDNTSSVLCKGKGNVIWVGTYAGGLNRFDANTGKCKRYQNMPGVKNSLSSNRVWAITEDKEGVVWIGTENGLNRLEPSTGSISRYFHQEGNGKSLCHNSILSICKDRHGVLWTGTTNGLCRAMPGPGNTIKEFITYRNSPAIPSSLSSNIVMSFFEAADGTMWIGTSDGLNKYDPATNSFKVIRFSERADTTSQQVYSYLNSYGANAIRAMYEDQYHNLWLSTDAGLKIYNPQTGEYSAFNSDPTNPNTLSADLLSGIFEDRSHNIWIGTIVGGLNRADLKPQKFTLCQTQNGNACHLSRNNVRALFADRSNTLWVGTLAGGLNRMNGKTGRFEQFGIKAIDEGNIWCIYEDSKGMMWIGTSIGLCRLDPATNEHHLFSHSKSDPQSISDNIVRSIFEDSKGNLWIGTEGGLNLFDPAAGTFIRFLHDEKNPTSLSHNTVWCVRERSGVIWVGTDNGLNKLIRDDKGNPLLFKHYLPRKEDTASLSNRSVRSIWIGGDGGFWIGTSNGLNKFDPATEKFVRFNEEDGLANSYIYGVLGDNSGHLWISSNNGISRFTIKTSQFVNYDKLDGLQNNEFNTGAYCKGPNGELFFGGPDGFNRFFPDSLFENKIPPPVAITSIRLFGMDWPGFRQGIKEMTLNYDQNVISFEFAALDFTLPEKNHYEYQLVGFDKHWVKGDARRFVSYTNLDPGVYTFRLRASNNDGTWNNEGLSLKLTIVPPLWKTWWFRIAALAALVVSIYAWFRRRLIRLRKIQVFLEEQVSIKTKELREEKEVVDQQNKLIEKKNHNITSSIKYARRIQQAILPIKEKLNETLPESFILFKPKDIVSGDFYWFAEERGTTLIAAVDCTGHGVPGAFMSLIGNNLLNDIVKTQGILDPGQILRRLHEGLVTALKKSEQESDTVDGMDIALCVMDCDRRKLEFSSTGRPLVLVRGSEIRKFKTGKHPLGLVTKKEISFGKESITLQPNDAFYIFTDGYCDQFGGPQDNKYLDSNFERLLLKIQDRPMQEQSALLEKEIEEWRGQNPQTDDMLVIGIRC